MAIDVLKGAYRFSMRGGIVVCDVRDVARLHAAVMEPDRGPRRYMVPSVLVEMREWLDRFERITGRNFPTTMLPTGMVLAQPRLLDAVQRVAPFRIPLNFQSAYSASRFPHWDGWDDSATTEEFGILKPDVDRVFGDTVRWLYEQGHVPAKRVGRLAGSSGTA